VKTGDTVRHKTKGWVGIVAGFMKRNPGVLINLSDASGIRFRWVHRKNLEVISGEKKKE